MKRATNPGRIEQLISQVKQSLIAEHECESWEKFVDQTKTGDCQGIVAGITGDFPQLQACLGEVRTDEPYRDEVGRKQNWLIHHWVEFEGTRLDFTKNSLKGYVAFDDPYDPNVEPDVTYRTIGRKPKHGKHIKKTMTANDYLKSVAETVARLGHRDNQFFLQAATISNQALRSNFSDPVMLNEARRCRNSIDSGLKDFMPGARWFDAVTGIEYATLLATFNSITRVNQTNT